ncbi:MAG TPA: hypothetical protein VFV34_24085 [Blastocatellia bacterium]|nr:hypothetical protein [Blastocatellia bacterium]
MNCGDFEGTILEIARGELLDRPTREKSVAHADTCARCADRLAEERELIRSVRLVVAEIAGDEAPASVETAVLNEFRKKVRVIAPMSMPALPLRRSAWRLAAAAAVILVLIAAMVLYWRRSFSSDQKREEHVAAPVVPKEDKKAAPWPEDKHTETGDNGSKLASGQGDRGKHPHERAAARLTNREVVTRFIPLTEGVDLRSFGDFQVVRVELSGSSLIAIGLPVETESNKTVKADVLLGRDGVARAIRFVR